MAKAPEKKYEAPKPVKVNYDVKGLAAHAANMVVVHQFLQAVHSVPNTAVAGELMRANNELIKALENDDDET